MNNTDIIQDQSDFHWNGCTLVDVPESVVTNDFMALLRSLRNKRDDDETLWERRYKGSVDLKILPYLYSPLFLNFIFENKLHTRVAELTGYGDLVLGAIELRMLLPGELCKGGWSWHRDTVRGKKNTSYGFSPPLHKMIFYPHLGDEPKTQLSLIKGSHLDCSKNRKLDLVKNIVKPKFNVMSDDKRMVLFNARTYHVPREAAVKKGALRVFFLFCHKSQLSQAQFPNHQELHRMYFERLKKEKE